MKKVISLFAIIMVTIIVSGCSSQPKPLYTYGDYSESYYASKKESTAESALALKKSIEYAIEHTDDSSSGRVAPGMYANLGYIYLKANDMSKAIENFNKEKLTYPESAYFMEKMINKIKKSQGETK